MPVVKLWDLHTTIFKFMKASYQILNLFRKTSKKMLIEKSHSYGGGNATEVQVTGQDRQHCKFFFGILSSIYKYITEASNQMWQHYSINGQKVDLICKIDSRYIRSRIMIEYHFYSMTASEEIILLLFFVCVAGCRFRFL